MKVDRERGKRGEREAATLLRRVFPQVATSRAGGESAEINRGRDLLSTPGYCIQVKLRAKIFSTMLNEAKHAARPEEIPVLIARQPRSNWIAVLDLDDLIDMMDDLRGSGGRPEATSEP